MRFVNRDLELKALDELKAQSKKKFFTVALYGLRRVGKTRLMLEFLKGKGVYFFVNKNKTSTDLLKEFENVLRKNSILKELEALSTWDDFFKVCCVA